MSNIKARPDLPVQKIMPLGFAGKNLPVDAAMSGKIFFGGKSAILVQKKSPPGQHHVLIGHIGKINSKTQLTHQTHPIHPCHPHRRHAMQSVACRSGGICLNTLAKAIPHFFTFHFALSSTPQDSLQISLIPISLFTRLRPKTLPLTCAFGQIYICG